MIELNKKYIVVYKDNTIIAQEKDNTGHVYPAIDTQYFETDNENEFNQFIADNNLIDSRENGFINI